jgi:hypothetical protein
MHDNWETDSNVTVESDRHSLKHFSQSRSTEDGMQIDERETQQKNAEHSNNEREEPGSKVIVERESHP